MKKLMNITIIFDRVYFPSSDFLNVTDISSLPTIKIDIYAHSFIKYDILETIVIFPSRGTPISIINCHFVHHNMTYIYQANNNIPWNIALPARQRTNVWIISIVRKYPNTFQQVIEVVSSQQLSGESNKVNTIIAHRGGSILRKTLQ